MNKYNLNKDDIINKLTCDEPKKEYINNNLIMLTVSGSHAYGTNTPESDMDIRGMFIGEPKTIIGLNRMEQVEDKENDITIFELSKILQLVADQNPNCHELLFCDKEDIIFATDEYWKIREQRVKFISSLARQKYSGYAMSQLKRVKGHSKWLSREQNGEFNNKPEMIDYCRIVDANGHTSRDRKHLENLSCATFLTHETDTCYKIWTSYDKIIEDPFNIIINYNGWFENENCTFYFKESIDKENRQYMGLLFFAKDEFTNALEQYNKWKNWKENRNDKRHLTEEKFGYDTKHAMHLVRLLRMGKEILSGQGVLVKRLDAQELLEIRNGKWTYDELIEYAANMDNVVLEEAYKNTKLPRSVDKEFVNELLINTYLKFWKNI
jgi:uncharacterized protein